MTIPALPLATAVVASPMTLVATSAGVTISGPAIVVAGTAIALTAIAAKAYSKARAPQ